MVTAATSPRRSPETVEIELPIARREVGAAVPVTTISPSASALERRRMSGTWTSVSRPSVTRRASPSRPMYVASME